MKNNLGSDEFKKPFLDHLEDLRLILFQIFAVLTVTSLGCFIFARQLVDLYKRPLITMLENIGSIDQLPHILKSFLPTGAFILSLKVALFGGLLLSTPFSLFFIIRFIKPALSDREKKFLKPSSITAVFLFCLGVLFCYFLCIPITLKFLWQFNTHLGITPLWTIESYISLINLLLFSFGLAFEMPLFIIILIKLDIVSTAQLCKYRKYVIVIIFFLSALLTPPDIFSQILLSIPLVILYEICILFARWTNHHENNN